MLFGKPKNQKAAQGKEQALGTNCIENLINAMSNVVEGRITYLTENELGNAELTENWNRMIKYICDDKREVALQVNGLLQYVTRMDFVKDMVDSVNSQTEGLHTMAANSQEMSASIEDVSGLAQVASSNATEADRIAIEGTGSITKAFDFVKRSFDEIEIIDVQMKEVMERTNKINQIIDMVKGIADQTNLLSLNAAIEAARAGEMGRGFAVVADEVKKLAEHSKESALDVQNNISSLQKDINIAVDKINNTFAQLEAGKQLVDSGLSSVNVIGDSVREVNDKIGQIAANTEEQSAVTEGITQEVNNLAASADELLGKCGDTGRAIFDLSKMLDKTRGEAVKNKFCLSDIEFIDIYITDHLLWRWRIYNMILGYEKADISSAGDYRNCRLGKWYYGGDCERLKKYRAYTAMETPHIELHNLAREAIAAYEGNNIRGAEEALFKMDECSKKVVDLLNELKGELKREQKS